MFKKLLNFFTWKNKTVKRIADRNYQWYPVLTELQASENRLNDRKLRAIGRIVYERLLQSHLKDSQLSTDEKVDLEKLADFCKLSTNLILKMNLKAFRGALKSSAESHRLSETREQQLKAMVKGLSLPRETAIAEVQKFDWSIYKALDRIERGILPTIHSSLPMQRGEVCHFIAEAVRLVSKTKTTGFRGGSKGVSFRLTTGISVRFGRYGGERIQEKVDLKYPGRFVITSKRLIFAAPEKGFSFRIGHVTNVDSYANGIGIQKGSRYYRLIFDEQHTELSELLLERVLKSI